MTVEAVNDCPIWRIRLTNYSKDTVRSSFCNVHNTVWLHTNARAPSRTHNFSWLGLLWIVTITIKPINWLRKKPQVWKSNLRWLDRSPIILSLGTKICKKISLTNDAQVVFSKCKVNNGYKNYSITQFDICSYRSWQNSILFLSFQDFRWPSMPL